LSEEYDEAINSASASDSQSLLLDQVHCRTLYIVLTNSRLQSPWSVISDGCGLGRWRHCQ